MVNERPMSGQLSDVTHYAHQDIMSVEPPMLGSYRDAPIYDHTLILRLLSVRPLALWSWEQHVGIASGARGAVEQSGQKRRYSERDLVALLWLRERVVEGESPQDAGARLIAAQRQRNSGALNSGALGSGALNTEAPNTGAFGSGALGSGALGSGALGSGALGSGALGSGAFGIGGPSGPLGRAQSVPGGRSGPLGSAQSVPVSGGRSGPLGVGGQNTPFPGYPQQPRNAPTPSGPLAYYGEYPSGSFQPAREPQTGITGGLGGSAFAAGAAYPTYPQDANRGEYPSGSWTGGTAPYMNPARPLNPSRPLSNRGLSQTTPSTGGTSGRLGAIYGAPMPITRPTNGFDSAHDLATARELRWLVSPLMQAFARFDTPGANRLMQQALEQYSVEVVCLGLVQPAIVRVSDLWSRSELTIPEERFAFSYLRGFLTSVFHSTMEPEEASLVVVGCAQRDTNDLSALMLAVFWRRSGLRVIYLGADAGADELARQRWDVIPAIITLTMTTSQRIRSVNHLAKQLRGAPSPRPDLCYTGGVFVRNPDLQRKVNAVYLGDDPAAATTTVRRLLGMIF